MELPFGDEEDEHETLAEKASEVTPSVRKSNKRKETAQAQDGSIQLAFPVEFFKLVCLSFFLVSHKLNPDIVPCLIAVESSSPPPTKTKRLRKGAVSDSAEVEEHVATPTTTTKTNEELREAFDAVEKENKISRQT